MSISGRAIMFAPSRFGEDRWCVLLVGAVMTTTAEKKTYEATEKLDKWRRPPALERTDRLAFIPTRCRIYTPTTLMDVNAPVAPPPPPLRTRWPKKYKNVVLSRRNERVLR